MARQQTAPGAVGAVSVRKGSRGWRGRARVRDWSGEVRELSRFGATRVEATEKISAAVSEALLRGGHESIMAATDRRRSRTISGHSDIGSTMIYMDRRQGSPRAAAAL